MVSLSVPPAVPKVNVYKQFENDSLKCINEMLLIEAANTYVILNFNFKFINTNKYIALFLLCE